MFWTVLLVAIGVLLAIELVTPAYYSLMKAVARRAPEPPRGGNPSVTVILPTYNEEDTILDRLNDLRDHGYAPMDVIVVDGASTDATRAIVRRFQTENPGVRLRLIEQEVRSGKVGGVRAALPHATGDLVCLTDAAPSGTRARSVRPSSASRTRRWVPSWASARS